MCFGAVEVLVLYASGSAVGYYFGWVNLPLRGSGNNEGAAKLARAGPGRDPGAVAPGSDCDRFDVKGISASSRRALLPS